MTDCCATNEQIVGSGGTELCPSCDSKGKKVKIITLKSILKPNVLDTLNPDLTHYFCSTEDCDVVYFNTDKKTYPTSEIKVSVYQKNNLSTVPVCYCFDWSREKITKYVEEGIGSKPLEHIRQNVKEDRCGCEVNNPQGSCCMGNVTKFIKSL
ncbi:(2Fe-2S)-binding protein [Psychrobacillus sp. NPDC058041]|uniref:putative iron-sulfur cluster-binding metallochaperone n=1 Tax=Psychrobacillus sp. NPDC058041 TaxID=3346310 RepID=UPI0036DC7C3C